MRRSTTVTAFLLAVGMTTACSTEGAEEADPVDAEAGTVVAEEEADDPGEEPAEPEDASEVDPTPEEQPTEVEPPEDAESDPEAEADQEADGGDDAVAIDTIPEDAEAIDEDYVQELIDATDPLIGEIMAQLEAVDEIDEELHAEVGLVYEATWASDIIRRIVGEDADYVVPDTSGPASTELEEIQTATTECISTVVVRDVTGYFEPPGDPSRWGLTFVPGGHAEDTGVAWLVAGEFLEGDDGELSDGCDERS